MICDADTRQAQTAEKWYVLRTAHGDESVVRPFAFYRERSEEFDDRFTVFSQENYRTAQ